MKWIQSAMHEEYEGSFISSVLVQIGYQESQKQHDVAAVGKDIALPTKLQLYGKPSNTRSTNYVGKSEIMGPFWFYNIVQHQHMGGGGTHM